LKQKVIQYEELVNKINLIRPSFYSSLELIYSYIPSIHKLALTSIFGLLFEIITKSTGDKVFSRKIVPQSYSTLLRKQKKENTTPCKTGEEAQSLLKRKQNPLYPVFGELNSTIFFEKKGGDEIGIISFIEELNVPEKKVEAERKIVKEQPDICLLIHYPSYSICNIPNMLKRFGPNKLGLTTKISEADYIVVCSTNKNGKLPKKFHKTFENKVVPFVNNAWLNQLNKSKDIPNPEEKYYYKKRITEAPKKVEIHLEDGDKLPTEAPILKDKMSIAFVSPEVNSFIILDALKDCFAQDKEQIIVYQDVFFDDTQLLGWPSTVELFRFYIPSQFTKTKKSILTNFFPASLTTSKNVDSKAYWNILAQKNGPLYLNTLKVGNKTIQVIPEMFPCDNKQAWETLGT